MKRIITSIALLAGSLVATAAETQKLVMTTCLLDKLTVSHQVLAKRNNFALISISRKDIEAVAHASHSDKSCGRFFDVSFNYKKGKEASLLDSYSQQPRALKTEHFNISHQAQVKALIAESDPNNMWKQLEHLTSFKNRYADSEEGVAAIEWVKQQFDSMATANKRTDVDSYFVQTKYPSYRQPSLVTVIGKDKPGDAVVVGAHIDTYSGRKQGADDDGTGSANNLELARVLLSTKTQFKHPIYILWYSAEEWGLIGSQNVVRDFKAKHIPVKAVMQIDMSGYNSENNDVYIVKDYTDQSLNDFTAELVRTYTGVKPRTMYCGYACSDHASWTKEHIKSVMPFEADLGYGSSPYIHTAGDTLETVSLEHMTVYLKLALSFVGELAEAQ
jgi:leucyl aminopeptidase